MVLSGVLLGLSTGLMYPVLAAAAADHAPPGRLAGTVGVVRFWRDLGRVVQIDPMKLILKAPRSKRLKLAEDKLLSNLASNFSLRRYTWGTLWACPSPRWRTPRPPRPRCSRWGLPDIARHVIGCHLT